MGSSSSGAERRYWLMTADVPSGPFDVRQVHAKLASGEITWETRACAVGASTWLPLLRVPGLGPDAGPLPHADQAPPATPFLPDRTAADGIPLAQPAAEPTVATAMPGPAPLPRPAEAVTAAEPSPAKPWNPVAIAWLGVPFTPMWAGVMAALNGRRLGAPAPGWLPVAIGFGYLALDLGIGLVYESYLLSVVLYAGALVALWTLVLQPQRERFCQWQASLVGATARWVWPSVAGAPLAVLVFFGFAVLPLLPLEPREVCVRFEKAGSAKEAARYTTANLVPALQALERLKDTGEVGLFELTDEAPAPPEVGGYLVGWRSVSKEGGRQVQMEGVYHLFQWSGEWKIEDLYITTFDRQELPQWVSLARDYQQIVQAARESRNAAPGAGAHAPPPVPNPPRSPAYAFDRLIDWGSLNAPPPVPNSPPPPPPLNAAPGAGAQVPEPLPVMPREEPTGNAAPGAGASAPLSDKAQTPTATSWQKSINRSQQWRGIGLLVLLGGAALVYWLKEHYRAKYAEP